MPSIELSYQRVSTSDPESASSPGSIAHTPKQVSLLRRVARVINNYLQIVSSSHSVLERKLSFGVFLVLFCCFLFVCIFAASHGDMCGSYEEGIARVKLDRDRLAERVELLTAELEALRNANPTT